MAGVVVSGPMGEGPLPPEEERNVTPERDDEELDDESEAEPVSRFVEHGGTHFAARFRPNQRRYGG